MMMLAGGPPAALTLKLAPLQAKEHNMTVMLTDDMRTDVNHHND